LEYRPAEQKPKVGSLAVNFKHKAPYLTWSWSRSVDLRKREGNSQRVCSWLRPLQCFITSRED